MFKRKISFEIYAPALLFTVAIFLLGIYLGNSIAYSKADSLQVSQNAISALFDVANSKEANFSSAQYCNLSWSDIWKEKVALGDVLADLEGRLGKDNPKVLELKKTYHDVEIKTLNLVENVNSQCDYKWDVVLFFYTNDKSQNYTLSDVQGAVLDTLFKENPSSFKIFSFDVNLKTNSTDKLIDKYNIKSAPSLVIDGKIYDRFLSKNEIKELIQ